MERQRRTKAFNEKGMVVGRRIADYLLTVGVSQKEIAEKCFDNINMNLINRRLNGHCDLSVGEYMAICDYLNVPYGKFMEGEV